jgi:membrane protein
LIFYGNHPMKKSWQLFREAFLLFKANDPLRMAGATAFFTAFALPPILIILIQIFGLVLNRSQLSHQLFSSLAFTLGKPSEATIRETLHGFQRLNKNEYITVAGFLFLLFVATTLFKVIKDSLNQLWNIRLHETNWSDSLLPRLKSLVIILFTGALFLSELTSQGVLALVRPYAEVVWPEMTSILFFTLRQAISLLVVTAWFTVLFKYLPDGSYPWRTTIAGALVTGVLFTAGKLLLGWLLAFSNIKNIYGASGSFVLVLLFLFYVSMILYYGAAFTSAWAAYQRSPVSPGKHASLYQLKEVE